MNDLFYWGEKKRRPKDQHKSLILTAFNFKTNNNLSICQTEGMPF